MPKSKIRPALLLTLTICAAVVVSGCRAEPEIVLRDVTREVEVTREVQVEVQVEVTKQVEVTRVVEQKVIVEVPAEPVAEIPFAALWVGSGHAMVDAEAFVHWDEDDPAQVPAGCAKCHSTPGYRDFLGIDGTQAGVVDGPAPIGTVVECVACHNQAASTMSSVVFPSGIEIARLGSEARCMQCHQGRAAKASVDDAIAEAGLTDPDVASQDLGFINIHYYAAAATLYGGSAVGGYQYDGKTYDVKFAHVPGYDSCVDCHNPHSLELELDECSTCHREVSSVQDLRAIRSLGSTTDYDGDGDIDEGIYFEIEGLQQALYQAIQAHAGDAGAPVVYESHTYPYWFADTDGNGEADSDEAAYANSYKSWTPRLLKAAYNYQVSLKDPGAFVHNGKYIIQLLYDSIEDLDAAGTEGLQRIDAGHFAGSQEAHRHWDEDSEVSSSCAKCHSATGLPQLLTQGVVTAQPVSNGFLCTTCHDAVPGFTRYAVETVTFPSGAELNTGQPDSNLCINCHQGRQSTVSVNRSISGLDLDAPSEGIRFANVHYFAAGATLFGTEAKGAYEYDGKAYLGRNLHVETADSCLECHDAHTLEFRADTCSVCHADAADPHSIRMSEVDYDGDRDIEEGLADEIATLHKALYEAIQAYADDVSGTAIVYDAYQYPYFLTTDSAGYNAWTPRLLQAGYNYQYAAKDPGAFAHNGKYLIQVLYDSLESLGQVVQVDMTGMVRPEIE